MNDPYREQAPLYVAGTLDDGERARFEEHIKTCLDCRDEIEFWRGLAGQIKASNDALNPPDDMAEVALKRIRVQIPVEALWLHAFNLLKSQAYLVKREMWPVSAASMALGVIVALIARQAYLINFLAPLIAAGCLANLYGPQNDPASELTLATPTSAWKILLARLTLVSAYNLFLALGASLILVAVLPVELPGVLILGWFAPLTFLSALALFFSMWIGSSNAITLTYALWIVRYLHPPQFLQSYPFTQAWISYTSTYDQFWKSPGLLLPLAFCLVCLALLLARREQGAARRLAY
jgi:hypothetical protein